MNILGIIPARSGSKGLRDKNIRLLNGKPLIYYTIKEAISSGVLDTVMVSTDSEKYADIARGYGASVPFLRDTTLAEDKSMTRDVVIDVLNKYKSMGYKYTHVMILQPTSPLRQKRYICESVELLLKHDAKGIISVCEMEHSPLIGNTLPEDKNMLNFINTEKVRRQDFEPYYRINGAIYLYNADYYVNKKNLYGSEIFAYVMDKKYSVDIDDEYDFSLAEYLIQKNK